MRFLAFEATVPFADLEQRNNAGACQRSNGRKEKANSTYMFTMKGCLTSFSTVISFRTCSTCFNLITSTIERIFKARGVPWCLHSTTLPKVPVPEDKRWSEHCILSADRCRSILSYLPCIANRSLVNNSDHRSCSIKKKGKKREKKSCVHYGYKVIAQKEDARLLSIVRGNG